MAARAGIGVHRQPWKFFEALGELLLEFAKAQFQEPNDDDPPCLAYLWRWFTDLQYDRDLAFETGYIRSSEYNAWAAQNAIALCPCELNVLKAIDRAYVVHCNAQAPRADGHRVVQTEMTPELFDRVFK